MKKESQCFGTGAGERKLPSPNCKKANVIRVWREQVEKDEERTEALDKVL